MAKKFYAVKIGKTPGVYETWTECQNQINGVSGAIYKGFTTKEEALAFVGGDNIKQQGKTLAVAYVDGSYDSITNAFSYGIVFFMMDRNNTSLRNFWIMIWQRCVMSREKLKGQKLLCDTV